MDLKDNLRCKEVYGYLKHLLTIFRSKNRLFIEGKMLAQLVAHHRKSVGGGRRFESDTLPLIFASQQMQFLYKNNKKEETVMAVSTILTIAGLVVSAGFSVASAIVGSQEQKKDIEKAAAEAVNKLNK